MNGLNQTGGNDGRNDRFMRRQGGLRPPDLGGSFQRLYEWFAFPPFRIKYSPVDNLHREYEEYGSYLYEEDFGPGWAYFVEGLEVNVEPTGASEYWSYSEVVHGVSISLVAAYEAAKNSLPEEAWPFISHQLLGRRERFYFAYEFELVHGSLELQKKVAEGFLGKFELGEQTLEDSPWPEWA